MCALCLALAAALKSKLDGLKVAQGGGQLVSKEKQATLKQTLERYRAAWKNRKAIVMEVGCEALCSGSIACHLIVNKLSEAHLSHYPPHSSCTLPWYRC